MEIEPTLGAWLRRQRHQLDLTQLELAQRVNCSVVTIRKLERNELRPSKQLAERLAQSLNIAAEHQAALIAFARGIGPSPQLSTTYAQSVTSPLPQAVGLSLRQHNLPIPTTPLVGRESELIELQHLFEGPDVRLVTILGVGGMGKTHLAQEMARQYLARTQEHVFFVALASLSVAEGLTTAIIDALGYPLQSDGRSPEQQLLDYLQPKQMLLVLDNFEHLLAGVGLVNAILRVAPGVKILVTSRQRLLLSGEIIYALGSLAYPTQETAKNMLDYGAVKLFVQRAYHLRPTFSFSVADYSSIARICRLVEGMPLGILLAAAWVDLLSLPAIADEISQSLDFLEIELCDLPERHRSIRAVFAHSWWRLTETDRLVFMQLAVFRGGFTRQAAQRVVGASLPQLRALVNQALLQVESDERYTLHELVHQYAMAELVTAQQSEDAFGRHRAYYMDLLAQCSKDLKGQRQIEVLTLLEVEHENVRIAWTWAVTHQDSGSVAQAMESLGFFCEWRGRFQEGERWFAQAAESFAQVRHNTEPPILPRLLTWQAKFTHLLGNQAKAAQLLHRALKLIDTAALNDQATQLERAEILHGLGELAYEASDRLESEHLFAQSLALYRTCKDRWGEAKVFLSLEKVDRNLPDRANPHQHRQATEKSKTLVLESLAIFQQIGDQANLSTALETFATVLLTLGLAKEAHVALTECLTIHRRLNTVNSSFIHAIVDLAIAEEYLGLYEQMHTQAQQAFTVAQAVGDVQGMRRACYLRSSVALVQCRYDEVRRCFQEETHLLQTGQLKTGLTVLQLVNCGLASYHIN